MPMERSRYPQNWEEISLECRKAAGWICQGCGKPCVRPGETANEFASRLESPWVEEAKKWLQESTAGWAYPQHRARFTLTTAHLDQNPANNSPNNLQALCAPCHLNYDRPWVGYNARQKKERHGQLRLFNIS